MAYTDCETDPKQLLDAATIAISLPVAERVAYVAGVFKNDPDYIQKVMKLVDSHQENVASQTSSYSCSLTGDTAMIENAIDISPITHSGTPGSTRLIRLVPIAASVAAAALLATSITFGVLALNAQQTNSDLTQIVDELSATVKQLEMAQSPPVAPMGSPGVRSASLPTQWR